MIFVPTVFYVLFFVYKWKKKHELTNIGSIIVIYYIVSSVFSVFYYYSESINASVKLGFIPTVLYCSLIAIIINPFFEMSVKDKTFDSIDQNNKTFYVISWILVILSLGYLLYIFSSVIEALSGNLGKIRQLSYLESNVSVSFPWYLYPSVYAKEFSPILLLFSFYSITFMKNSRLFNTLLFLSSLVLPISGVVSASRTQVVYWIMTASVLLLVFWSHMDFRNRKFVSAFIIISLVVAFLYIKLVTVSRFVDSAGDSIIGYIGQPYVQFCNVYNHYSFDGTITLNRIFPLISRLLSGEVFNVRVYRAYQTARIGVPTGVFLTLLGDAMLDFGKVGMVIFAIIIWIIEKLYVRRIKYKSFSLSTMIILTIIFRIPLLGLFAYMYLSIATSVVIIGSLFFAFCFSRIRLVIKK